MPTLLEWAAPSYPVVWCDTAKLERNWRLDPRPKIYLHPGSGHPTALAAMAARALSNQPTEIPKAGLAPAATLGLGVGKGDWVVVFENGRNRIRWCIDKGVTAVPLQFDWPASIERARALFGSELTVSILP